MTLKIYKRLTYGHDKHLLHSSFILCVCVCVRCTVFFSKTHKEVFALQQFCMNTQLFADCLCMYIMHNNATLEFFWPLTLHSTQGHISKPSNGGVIFGQNWHTIKVGQKVLLWFLKLSTKWNSNPASNLLSVARFGEKSPTFGIVFKSLICIYKKNGHGLEFVIYFFFSSIFKHDAELDLNFYYLLLEFQWCLN